MIDIRLMNRFYREGYEDYDFRQHCLYPWYIRLAIAWSYLVWKMTGENQDGDWRPERE